MFEVKLNVDQGGGFLRRLSGIGRRLFRSSKDVEDKLEKHNKEKPSRMAVQYEDDASESLAMALGKEVDQDAGRMIDNGVEDVLKDL